MRKCYDYIISIGLNCEIRYQLRKKFGAIESSLLEWAAIYSQHLIDVLKNPNLIFSEQIEELPKFNMWKCCLTNMTFHGKKLVNELLDQDGNRDEEKVAIEKQDTICRIKYLSNKFIKIANSESPEYVDLESGDKIFSEFVLKEQKVDNKIYKFEKECAI